MLFRSLKYTEKGFVKIIAEADDAEIRIWVEDTGVGIRAQTQEKLFDQRSDGPKNKNPNPLSGGIGLKISKMLAP